MKGQRNRTGVLGKAIWWRENITRLWTASQTSVRDLVSIWDTALSLAWDWTEDGAEAEAYASIQAKTEAWAQPIIVALSKADGSFRASAWGLVKTEVLTSVWVLRRFVVLALNPANYNHDTFNKQSGQADGADSITCNTSLNWFLARFLPGDHYEELMDCWDEWEYRIAGLADTLQKADAIRQFKHWEHTAIPSSLLQATLTHWGSLLVRLGLRKREEAQTDPHIPFDFGED